MEPERSDLAPLCTLDDPNRRRLYDYVAAASAPVTRDDASTALDLDRSLVAYHLDKLVEEGLLAASFARPPGRGGPGAGRPAKYYERADREFAVSLPPRDYRLVAELLARAVEADAGGVLAEALDEVATSFGRELARLHPSDGDELLDHLRRTGFEPYDDDGVVRLRNCPFHRVAEQHTELVCGMNRSLLNGLADALDAPVVATLDPAPGRCCVAFSPAG